MLSVIKTAIITIIISFISGVLLDNYKNFAPRILCTMGKAIPLRLNNKKIKGYILTVKNISNKTIHDLNLNVQGHYDNLKIDDAKITNGLKFDLSTEDNDYNVSIPFLSKNDEFSAKLFVEFKQGVKNKPVVTMRSPENFKRVESEKHSGFLYSLLSMSSNTNNLSITKNKNGRNKDSNKNEIRYTEKNLFMNKKVIMTIASILLAIYIGILGVEYNNKMAEKVDTSGEKTNTTQQSYNRSNSSSTAEKKSSENSSTNENSSSTDIDNSSSIKSSSEGTSSTSDKKSSSIEAENNTKISSDESSENSQPNNIENQKTESTNQNQKPENEKSNTAQSSADNNTNKDSVTSDKDKNSDATLKIQTEEIKPSTSQSSESTSSSPSPVNKSGNN